MLEIRRNVAHQEIMIRVWLDGWRDKRIPQTLNRSE